MGSAGRRRCSRASSRPTAPKSSARMTKSARQPQRVRDDSAEPLAGDHSEDGRAEKLRQHLLTSLIRDVVADPGHRQRNDAGSGRAGEEATRAQPFQGRRQRGRHGADRACKRGERDHAELSESVTQRPVEELQYAVSQREGRDHHCRGRRRGSELDRQCGQDGIGAAHGRQAREGGDAQHRQRALGRASGRRRCSLHRLRPQTEDRPFCGCPPPKRRTAPDRDAGSCSCEWDVTLVRAAAHPSSVSHIWRSRSAVQMRGSAYCVASS